MSQNQPVGAQETQDDRHKSICKLLIPAHQVSVDVKKDVKQLFGV